MSLQLDPVWLAETRHILQQHVPQQSVWAFGSRVSGMPTKWSDLDLVVWGSQPLDLITYGNLRNDFAESDLPIRVDIIDGSIISPEFRAEIERAYEIIQ